MGPLGNWNIKLRNLAGIVLPVGSLFMGRILFFSLSTPYAIKFQVARYLTPLYPRYEIF